MSNPHFESTITDTVDPLLEKLSDSVKPAAEQMESSDDHALIVLGIKNVEGEGLQTYTIATGFFGIIAEGLYAELSDQLEHGKPGLFMVFRQVIRDLEEDFGIDEDEEMMDEKRTLN